MLTTSKSRDFIGTSWILVWMFVVPLVYLMNLSQLSFEVTK